MNYFFKMRFIHIMLDFIYKRVKDLDLITILIIS